MMWIYCSGGEANSDEPANRGMIPQVGNRNSEAELSWSKVNILTFSIKNSF